MARRRMIEPDFFTDPFVIELPEPARLFYIFTWSAAEDSGVIQLAPATLALRSALAKEAVEQYIKVLIEKQKIIVFDEEQGLGWLKNFHRYQKIDKPSAPKLPLPTWLRYEKSETNAQEYRYVLVPSKYRTNTGLVPPKIKEFKGKEKKEKKEKRKEGRPADNAGGLPFSDSSKSKDQTQDLQAPYSNWSDPYAHCTKCKTVLAKSEALTGLCFQCQYQKEQEELAAKRTG